MLSEFQIRTYMCSQRPLPHQPITWRVSRKVVSGHRISRIVPSSSRTGNIISETRFLLSILQWLSTTTEIPRLPTLVSQLQHPRYRAHTMVEIITALFSVPLPIKLPTTYLKSTRGMVSTDSGAMMDRHPQKH